MCVQCLSLWGAGVEWFVCLWISCSWSFIKGLSLMLCNCAVILEESGGNPTDALAPNYIIFKMLWRHLHGWECEDFGRMWQLVGDHWRLFLHFFGSSASNAQWSGSRWEVAFSLDWNIHQDSVGMKAVTGHVPKFLLLPLLLSLTN